MQYNTYDNLGHAAYHSVNKCSYGFFNTCTSRLSFFIALYGILTLYATPNIKKCNKMFGIVIKYFSNIFIGFNI